MKENVIEEIALLSIKVVLDFFMYCGIYDSGFGRRGYNLLIISFRKCRPFAATSQNGRTVEVFAGLTLKNSADTRDQPILVQ